MISVRKRSLSGKKPCTGVIHAGLWNKFGMALLGKWKAVAAAYDKGLQEGWISPEEGYAFDHSHAWGGTPAYHLPLMLTGLRLLEAEFKRITLSPNLWDLDSADISFPTP